MTDTRDMDTRDINCLGVRTANRTRSSRTLRFLHLTTIFPWLVDTKIIFLFACEIHTHKHTWTLKTKSNFACRVRCRQHPNSYTDSSVASLSSRANACARELHKIHECRLNSSLHTLQCRICHRPDGADWITIFKLLISVTRIFWHYGFF